MNSESVAYLRSQYGKVQEKIKYALLSGKPVIFLHTQEMDIVNYLIDNKSIYKDYSTFSDVDNVKDDPLRYIMDLRVSDSGIPVTFTKPRLFILYNIDADGKGKLDSDISTGLSRFIQLYTGMSLQGKVRSQGIPDAVKRTVVIVVIPAIVEMPKDLETYSEYISVEAMEDDEMKAFITSEIVKLTDGSAACMASDSYGYVFLENKDFLSGLARNFNGLTRTKISQILIQIKQEIGVECLRNGDLNNDILKIIRAEKEKLIANSTILTLIRQSSKKTAAGLENLERYLEKKRKIIKDLEANRRQWGTDVPKGVLVSGIPGSGKSLMAKTAASMLGLPLIKMDMGDVQNKYVGSSERRMVETLALVEAMSPCVLWIDEIEKSLSGSAGQSSNDVTKRLFGKFLTWMQEKEEKHICCFVFATANDISSLPSELFRSGRFDAKFSTYMPSSGECGEIFASLINKQNKDYVENLEKEGIESDYQLFDSSKLDARLFETYLNSDLCLPEKVDRDSSRVTRANKFFTGSDIENVVKVAKEIYVLEAPHRSVSGNFVYDTELFKLCIEESLMQVRTYGETDLLNIASCYAGLAYNNFTPASGTDIMPISGYDEARKEMIDGSKQHVLYKYQPKMHINLRRKYGLRKNVSEYNVEKTSDTEKDFYENLGTDYNRCLYCIVRNVLNESREEIIAKRKGTR